MGSKATTTNFQFWPNLKFFLVYRTLSTRQKIINLRNQGSFDKKFDFFSQTLSHIPRWVRLVQKTRAKNSHAWAPLKKDTDVCLYAAYDRSDVQNPPFHAYYVKK